MEHGGDGQLLNADYAPYEFDMIYGLDYVIDLSADAVRITDLAYQGDTVADQDEFIVAANSYRANGGGGFVDFAAAEIMFRSAESTGDILVKSLRNSPDIAARPTSPWRFAPLGGQPAVFLSAPTADPRAVTDRTITATGQKIDGFAQFQILL